jgi:DNA-binding MarR family transcriptional regulator
MVNSQIDDNVQLPLSAPADHGEGTPDMNPVLRAFQSLLGRHAHVRSMVASTLGIGVSDLRALLFISGAEDTTPKQVGAYLELTSGAVTNLVDRMTDAGLVSRMPHPNDRRSVVLVLAPEGVEAVSRVTDLYGRAFASAVSPAELPAVADILNSLGESLTRTVDEDIARARAAGTARGTSAHN